MTLRRERRLGDEADSTTRRSARRVSATADSTTAVPASPARDGRERAHLLLGYRRCPLSRLRPRPGRRPRNRRPPGRREERRWMSATPIASNCSTGPPLIPPLHPANEWLCTAGAHFVLRKELPEMNTSPLAELAGAVRRLEDSEVARQAWRSMKNNSIGLSFGFLTVDSHDDDGVRVLDEVDLFEITLTPSPANADTRITEMKSVPDPVPSLDELKARFDRATKDLDLRPAPRIVSFPC